MVDKEVLKKIILEELQLLDENTLNRARQTWERLKKKTIEQNPEEREKLEQNFTDQAFIEVSKLDPTPQKKYLEWAIRQLWKHYVGEVLDERTAANLFSNDHEVKDDEGRYIYIFFYIDRFDQCVKNNLIQGPLADINQYKNIFDLYSQVSAVYPKLKAAKLEKSKLMLQKLDFSEQIIHSDEGYTAEIVRDCAHYYIVRVDDFQASCYFAGNEDWQHNKTEEWGARWCVANTSDYWRSYTEQDGYTIYFFIVTSDELLKALSLYAESYGMDSLPKRISRIIVGRLSDGGYDIKDVYNENIKFPRKEFFSLMNINEDIFKIVNGGDDEDAYYERKNEAENEAYNKLIKDIKRELAKIFEKDFEYFFGEDEGTIDTDDLADQVFEWLNREKDILDDVEFEYEEYVRGQPGYAYPINFDVDSLEQDHFEAILEALYHLRVLNPELVPKVEGPIPFEKRRPKYLDSDQYQQQDMFMEGKVYSWDEYVKRHIKRKYHD